MDNILNNIHLHRIMNIFLEDQKRACHVREVAKLLGLSPTTASKYLDKLKKIGLLTSVYDRNCLIYKAKIDSQNYKDLKIYTNIQKIRSTGLIEFIEKELNFPKAIVLFGSYARGENTQRSDIDLFIISSLKKEIDLAEFERKLKHKIQIFIFKTQEIKILRRKNKELMNNIINGIKLYGFLELI